MEKDMNTRAFAFKLQDPSKLVRSSSGGAFVALSDVVLEHGGAIACCVYDYATKELGFQIAETAEARDRAIGSKYFQATMGDIYNRCFLWLEKNPAKQLLFVGTGCQAAGLKRFLFCKDKAKLDQVYFVDLICHGVPSPKLWKEYTSAIEKENKGQISYVTFKDKRNGWKHPTAYARINDKEISLTSYVRAFNSHCMLRESCHNCPYTVVERETDITIGDFWGVEKKNPNLYDEKGVSLVLVHSSRGMNLLSETRKQVQIDEVSVEDCLQPRLLTPTSVSDKRADFWKQYDNKGAKYVIKKYGELSLMTRIKRKFLHH